MTRKKRRLISLVICILAVCLIGGTLAAWYAESPSIHIINTGALDGELVEEYNPPEKVYPGVDIDKVVNVENKGDVDMIVRIKVEKVWGSERDEETGKLVVTKADKQLDKGNIEIEFNTRWWMEQDDGYYYYRRILKPGEITLEPLFESFKMSDDTGNEYKGKHAEIVVSLDCIQAAGNAIEKQWDISYDELGISQPVPENSGKTSASFVSPDEKFAFTPESTDLFANFKNLVPGETREQQIEVKNAYIEEVEIFLRAEYIEQSLATAENIALVDAMLQRYALITVKNSSGSVIYEGPVWGNYHREPSSETSNDSMKNNISLGRFKAGAAEDLTVELSLAPELDNKYQDLWGLIHWVWSAQGVDPAESPSPSPSTSPSPSPGTSPSPSPGTSPKPSPGTGGSGSNSGGKPKTGDESNLVLWALSLTASAAALGAVVIAGKKKRKS